MTPTMLIHCNHATYGYDGKAAARDIHFQVSTGDYLCIVGENGSGKTTLMKGILGLLKPMSGSLTFGDGLKPTEIGYLPQQNHSQGDFPASVEEVVLSGRLNSGKLWPFYTRQDRDIAKENMEKLNVYPLRKQSFRELSGGQQQRVLLSRALCATKKMLLLDEPVSGLDPLATEELYQTIQALNQHITIVMISHDIPSAVAHGSHILHLGTDQLFYGTAETYMASEIGQYFGRPAPKYMGEVSVS